jgi:hypothetical protein
MLSTRKCVAAYATDNIKKELIQTVIQIILTDILPYSQFVTPVL